MEVSGKSPPLPAAMTGVCYLSSGGRTGFVTEDAWANSARDAAPLRV
jgi:hypothetical protein